MTSFGWFTINMAGEKMSGLTLDERPDDAPLVFTFNKDLDLSTLFYSVTSLLLLMPAY